MPSALVVDDDPTVGDVVGAYLVRAGFEVHRAADGATALDLAARALRNGCVEVIPGTDQYDDFQPQGLISAKNLDRFDGTSLTWRQALTAVA